MFIVKLALTSTTEIILLIMPGCIKNELKILIVLKLLVYYKFKRWLNIILFETDYALIMAYYTRYLHTIHTIKNITFILTV